jgi:hypothetical protein
MGPKTMLRVLVIAAVCCGSDGNSLGYTQRARNLIEQSPLIDTHIDLPQIMRSLCEINILANKSNSF